MRNRAGETWCVACDMRALTSQEAAPPVPSQQQPRQPEESKAGPHVADSTASAREQLYAEYQTHIAGQDEAPPSQQAAAPGPATATAPAVGLPVMGSASPLPVAFANGIPAQPNQPLSVTAVGEPVGGSGTQAEAVAQDVREVVLQKMLQVT